MLKPKSKPTSKKTTSKIYFTHDNGGRPFEVQQISPNVVRINVLEVTPNEEGWIEWDPKKYAKCIKKYTNVEKIFVGKSLVNATTKSSGGHGKQFDGNSILLKLRDEEKTYRENKYVFIGDRIYEFTTVEPIETFYSTVGNNDVPYPVALSKSFIYFMLEPNGFWTFFFPSHIVRVDKNEFLKNIVWSDAYHDYYESLEIRKFKSSKSIYVSVVQKRIW